MRLAQILESQRGSYEAPDILAMSVRDCKRQGAGWLAGEADIGRSNRISIGWYEGPVQTLTNLLSDALRHTPAGGWVTVGAEAGESGITFAVRDTGDRIAPEHLPRVLEQFDRVERSRSRSENHAGSGVGLTIARWLVEAMGGRIWSESPSPAKEATFDFTLPVSPADT